MAVRWGLEIWIREIAPGFTSPFDRRHEVPEMDVRIGPHTVSFSATFRGRSATRSSPVDAVLAALAPEEAIPGNPGVVVARGGRGLLSHVGREGLARDRALGWAAHRAMLASLDASPSSE